MEDVSLLEAKLGVVFTDKDLLLQALTHRSYLNENPRWRLDHNERLEFLGDAVIELTVTEFLYKTYPNPEGELTNWRASLVNARLLAQLAQEIGIGDHLLLSRGEARDTGRARQYILAACYAGGGSPSEATAASVGSSTAATASGASAPSVFSFAGGLWSFMGSPISR